MTTDPGQPRVRWLPCGDAAALAEVADLGTVLRLHAAGVAAREAGRLPGLVDLGPAARTLLVRCTDAESLRLSVAVIDDLVLPESAPDVGEEVTIPVRYDGEDLDDVAGQLGLDVAEVVRRHVATPWRVAFTGFAPGFGYLVPAGAPGAGAPLPVRRREESRTSVPAGSVGLAGEFSGVYPRSSPGGWQLIGRTDAVLWDAGRTPPALLAPGTRVRFEEV